jgi:hypothetical protein
VADSLFRCGIIEESLASSASLATLEPYFVSQRTSSMPDEDPPLWHVNEYIIPRLRLFELLPELEREIRKGWYLHAFNVEEDTLVVVLHGRSFTLPTVRDSSWDEMIEYGESVGCAAKWTGTIPLRV